MKKKKKSLSLLKMIVASKGVDPLAKVTSKKSLTTKKDLIARVKGKIPPKK
jgi:hypothetical protein